MSTVKITEGALVLELEAERCLKWDAHAAYAQHFQKLESTTAVDICASVAGDGAVLIEIKDYRGADQPRAEDLARIIANKTRDTLAGMVWASRRELGKPSHEALVGELMGRTKQLVVFWMEQNQLDATAASVLQSRIRQELLPHIPAKVVVTSTLLEKQSSSPLSWLRVRGLPAARIARRPRRANPTRKPKR